VGDKYDFLSDDWMEAAKAIRDELGPPSSPPAHQVKMNLVVTDAPFNDGASIDTHMDSSEGELKMDRGHVENPDLTVTVDWETAKAIFVEQNPQAGMQAFMAGKVKVTGDMTKLMAMQAGGAGPDEHAKQLAQRIKDITA
jgi:putative sterol carrier protein